MTAWPFRDKTFRKEFLNTTGGQGPGKRPKGEEKKNGGENESPVPLKENSI